MRVILCLAAALLAGTPATAATELKAKSGKAWKHKATGSEFPAALAGMERDRVVYFTSADVDVAAEYQSADGNDYLTVYFYRDVAGSVPVWFDRSRFFIMNLPDKYGSPKPTGTRAFTPRGQAVTSGLLETFEVAKGARSTGLMVLPFNGFYAKIRATSKIRDAAALEQLMLAAVNALDWTSKIPATAAAAVTDCAQPLAARGKAEPVAGSSEDRMMAGILGGLFSQVGSDESDPPLAVSFCREPNRSSLTYGLYRPDSSTERYVLALHDGGRAITVGRNSLSELVNGEIAGREGATPGPARYSVSFIHLDKVETYPDFASLPLPEQAIEQVEKGQPVAVSGTWGKGNRQITISSE